MNDDPMQRLIERIHSAKEAVWVFCGDSITHGALHTQGYRDYTELVSERVRYERGWAMHLFVNSGISGDTTRGILNSLQHRVLRFEPDIFSLMIGMNDCARLPEEEFQANLQRIIEAVRRGTHAEILLQTCCAIHPELTPERKAYPRFMDIVRETAASLRIALIDHHATWEHVRVQSRPIFDSWMANAFHPNALGHWIFAERILKELNLGPLEKTPPPHIAGRDKS